MEIWSPIKGYPAYHVSRRGRFGKFEMATKKIKVLSPQAAGNGYLHVELCRSGTYRKQTLASVMLETFVGPRPKGFHAAHLNGKKRDNRLINLAWVTPKENIGHNRLHGKLCIGQKNGNSKLTEADVRLIRANFKSGSGTTVQSLANRFGISKGHVYVVARSSVWRHIAKRKKK